MFCDFHTHVLPEIDDGAENLTMSLAMLKTLKKQGVDKVIATPHFYAHRQAIQDFVQDRKTALAKIMESCPQDIPDLTIGAEVYLERGMRHEDLRPLCIQNTPYILIEMPYMHFESWMLEEVYQLSLNQSLTPIFAHLDRYFPYYASDEIQEILDFDDAIIQVNHSALFSHKSLKTVVRWINEGQMVVTGSDCHNMTSRAPNDRDAIATLKSKLGKKWMASYSNFVEELFKNT